MGGEQPNLLVKSRGALTGQHFANCRADRQEPAGDTALHVCRHLMPSTLNGLRRDQKVGLVSLQVPEPGAARGEVRWEGLRGGPMLSRGPVDVVTWGCLES